MLPHDTDSDGGGDDGGGGDAADGADVASAHFMCPERGFRLLRAPPSPTASEGAASEDGDGGASAASAAMDEAIQDARRFQETAAALGTLGVEREARARVWRALAAVLWLGEIEFVSADADDGDAVAVVRSEDAADGGGAATPLAAAAVALGLAGDDPRLVSVEGGLSAALCERTVTDVRVPRKPIEAAAARDAAAAALCDDTSLAFRGGFGRYVISSRRANVSRGRAAR